MAKELFREGIALLKVGDYEGALDYFLQSRDVLPSYQNTRNAASCLDRLGRHDEALEMYQALLLEFSGGLGPADRAQLEARMADLRRRTATLEVTSNVDGTLLIDGRPRGRLPLRRPLRVNGGWRVVRVAKEGYRTYEATVDARPGFNVVVEARLARIGPLPPPPPPPPPPPYRMAGWFIDAYGGFAGGAPLASDAERIAEETCEGGACPGASGYLLGVRAGYAWDFGLALELCGGAMNLTSAFNRTLRDSSSGRAINYRIDDEVLWRGALVGAGLSYRLRIGPWLGLLGRFTAGLASAQTAERIQGTASTLLAPADQVDVVVTGRDRVLRSIPPFVMPEIGALGEWGPLHVGLTLGLGMMMADGPRHGRRQMGVAATCTPETPEASIRCAPTSTAVAGERSYGRFTFFAPQLTVGVTLPTFEAPRPAPRARGEAR